MPTKSAVMKKLTEVIDPELGINLVDLGLIYDVIIKGASVTVKMTFTTPACPLGAYLVESVKDKALEAKGVKDVVVELVWNPPWTPDRMNKKIRDLF